MTMADKIVVMRDGIVEQIGTPLELYDRPANLFVAGFIGSPAMNHIKGTVRNGAFEVAGGFRLPLSGLQANTDGRAAIYGARPEHFTLSERGLPAQITVVEPTGSETHVMANLGPTPVVCVFRERISAGPGDTIHIAPTPEVAHLFDADTGRTLRAA
jgi:multiple sugar transport system ATP-binding protein